MGMLDDEPSVTTFKEVGLLNNLQASPARPVSCNDSKGHVLPVTPEEQARDARAIAGFVERMLAMPDEDPPGAWKEAVRRKLEEN